MNPEKPLEERVISTSPLNMPSRYIIPLSMLFLTFMLAADVIAFKFVNFHGLIFSGATLIFPFTYLFGDVIAEVYGYNVAKKIIWTALFAELFFAIVINFAIYMPDADFAKNTADFNVAVGSMLKFVVGGIVGNLLSGFLNVYLISRWKILLGGRVFWLRSIFSTAISELVIIAVAVVIGFSSIMSLKMQIDTIIYAYALEIFYAFVFVWPAWLLCTYLKVSEGIDSYDIGINYNPFHLSSNQES